MIRWIEGQMRLAHYLDFAPGRGVGVPAFVCPYLYTSLSLHVGPPPSISTFAFLWVPQSDLVSHLMLCRCL